jgi:hypothetical protein
MIDGLTTGLDPALAPRDMPGRAQTHSRLSSRLRSLVARLRDCFEDHGDHFAEVERSLPARLRDGRRARRESDRLMLIAVLAR